jgi:hypothetical protein
LDVRWHIICQCEVTVLPPYSPNQEISQTKRSQHSNSDSGLWASSTALRRRQRSQCSEATSHCVDANQNWNKTLLRELPWEGRGGNGNGIDGIDLEFVRLFLTASSIFF